MADTEDQGSGQATGSSEGSSAQERQFTEVEQKAMSQGWVPEDQYEGAGKWRTAEDFLDRGEFFAKFDELNRRNKHTEATLAELKKHYKMVAQTEYKRALDTLKAQKKDALDNGDTYRVVELDEEIADTKAEAAAAVAKIEQQPAQQGAPNAQFVAWVTRNQWYNNDRIMAAAANAMGDELAAQGQMNPTVILQEIEKRIKKEFPHKFVNPNRSKAGAVEGGGGKGTQASDNFELSPEEKIVMNRLVKAKVLTKEQYIADIKAKQGVQ